MSPDTTAVTSIAKVLFDEGYGVGLVTSVAIDDATPGHFTPMWQTVASFTTPGGSWPNRATISPQVPPCVEQRIKRAMTPIARLFCRKQRQHKLRA